MVLPFEVIANVPTVDTCVFCESAPVTSRVNVPVEL